MNSTGQNCSGRGESRQPGTMPHGSAGWPTVIAHGPPRTRSRVTAYITIGVAALIVVASLGILAIGHLSSPGTPACAISRSASPATQTPIQHLFILIKENHAFENYFGALPGVIGFPPNGSLPVAFGSTQVVHPFALTGDSTPDLPHTQQANLADLNGGANNMFVAEANASGVASPEDAAGYYTARQLPDYYDYAQYYGLADRFFTGVLGPTEPNRVFDLSAYVGSWNADSTPPANVTSHPTVLDQLTGQGIPWNYDYAGSPIGLTADLFPSLRDSTCNSARILPISDLPSQLRTPGGPSVVYIDPSMSALYSEHPPENVTLGEEWSVAVINAILGSPEASSSAILVLYDENGGYWDPVVPPITSTGRDGFRVPLLVLSPWTEPGTICSQSLDPASILHFIDLNWGLPFLNQRVADAASLSCLFNFSSTPRSPLLLPTNVSLTVSPPPVGRFPRAGISATRNGFPPLGGSLPADPVGTSSGLPFLLPSWLMLSTAAGSERSTPRGAMWRLSRSRPKPRPCRYAGVGVQIRLEFGRDRAGGCAALGSPGGSKPRASRTRRG
ncbi:MAG: hypothetical protein HKL79_00500, partial [Thermoplasmata archaeon]|nr:hypothetical protein [Thermoplasmata archaeon]